MKFDRSGVDALMEITKRPELVFVRGQGSWLEDHNGKRYLDFVQGWAVNCLGHCPANVVKAINEQAALLINRSEEHTSELQSLMRNSYAVFCLKKKTKSSHHTQQTKT